MVLPITIITRARMGSESIAHDQKYRDKTTLASKTRFSRYCFGFQSGAFRYQWAITYSLVVAQPIRTQHW